MMNVRTHEWVDVVVGGVTTQQAFIRGADGVVYLCIRSDNGGFIADVPTKYNAA